MLCCIIQSLSPINLQNLSYSNTHFRIKEFDDAIQKEYLDMVQIRKLCFAGKSWYYKWQNTFAMIQCFWFSLLVVIIHFEL